VGWFYFVNGIEGAKGAAATNVAPGSRVWWDLRDWSATENVPAVVGSFPQPFLSGYGGKRLPVRVECAAAATSACTTISRRLQSYGVPAAIAAIETSEPSQTLRILVGTDSELMRESVTRTLSEGPRASGVYAILDGPTLTALTPAGKAAESYGAGSGLIAATGEGSSGPPVWFVTGTDTAGVERAARALGEGELRNRYAVALPARGGVVALPVVR
jgi:hypothetical protein